MCYQPPTIACAVIWLAARTAQVKLPTSPPWWELFDAELEDIENVSRHIMRLYALRLPPNLPITLEELESYLISHSNKDNKDNNDNNNDDKDKDINNKIDNNKNNHIKDNKDH